MTLDKTEQTQMHGREAQIHKPLSAEKREKGKRGRRAGGFVFPRLPLKQALVLAELIERENAGQPFSRITLAKLLDQSPSGDNFRALILASARYGLTIGSHSSDKMALTENGRSIVSISEEQIKKNALLNALMLPKVFQDVFTRYNGKYIPSEISLKDLLKTDFGVPPEDVNAVYGVLQQNMTDYGLIENIKGSKYLQLEKLAAPSQVSQTNVEVDDKSEKGENLPDTNTITKVSNPPQVPPIQQQIEKIPRVFISHSKNKKILENIKQTLTFGKFDSRVAEEKETLAIPLSDKVFSLMQECNCAIINISADEEKKQGEIYGINENVLIEIGASFLYYNKRVLLVIDKKLKERLPSILQGLTAIFYEGQELTFNEGLKLMEVLGEFRNKL